MNDLESRAYGYVARAVAQLLFELIDPGNEEFYRNSFPDSPRPIFYHLSMSCFEHAAHDLWRLHVLRPLDQKGDRANYFVLDCELDAANVVAESNSAVGPTLFKLLVTFTNLFEEFGGSWGYSVQSDVPFGAQSRIEPVLDALAAIGCLTKSSAGYVWTELMVPVRNATDDGWPDPTIGERA